MTVTQVTSLEQFIEIINEDRVVVFEFGPAWSSPIEGMSSMFGRFSRDFPSFDFYKVDDDHRDIMEQAGIPSSPAFATFKSGRKLGQLDEASSSELDSLLRAAILC